MHQVILEGEAHKKSFGTLFFRTFLKNDLFTWKTIGLSSWIQYQCCTKPTAAYQIFIVFPPRQ